MSFLLQNMLWPAFKLLPACMKDSGRPLLLLIVPQNPSLSFKQMLRYGSTIIIVLIDVMPQIKVRSQDRENCGF